MSKFNKAAEIRKVEEAKLAPSHRIIVLTTPTRRGEDWSAALISCSDFEYNGQKFLGPCSPKDLAAYERRLSQDPIFMLGRPKEMPAHWKEYNVYIDDVNEPRTEYEKVVKWEGAVPTLRKVLEWFFGRYGAHKRLVPEVKKMETEFPQKVQQLPQGVVPAVVPQWPVEEKFSTPIVISPQPKPKSALKVKRQPATPPKEKEASVQGEVTLDEYEW